MWLVGTDGGNTGNTLAPYIAHWDGVRWSRSEVGVRRGLLEDVSVFSSDSVWAAGYASFNEYGESHGTVVLRWDGDEWLEIDTPTAIDGLDNITATDRDEAWVVPDYYVGEPSPLWRWDGSTWRPESSPVRVISAMSALDGILWATGSNDVTVAVSRLGDGEWQEASIKDVESRDADDSFPGLVAVSEDAAWGVGREPVASRACVESS